MRIVIDLQACQNGSRHRGIGRYAMDLTKAMLRLDTEHTFFVCLSTRYPDTIQPVRDALDGLLPQERIIVFSTPDRTSATDPGNAWRNRAAEIVRSYAIEGVDPDIVFIPNLFDGIWDETVVSVEQGTYLTAVTLHDLVPMVYPTEHIPEDKDKVTYFRKIQNIHNADLILAISDYIRDEATRLLGVPPLNVISTLEGADTKFENSPISVEHQAEIMARLKIKRPFLLNTSPLEFRKNLEGLIAGFASLPVPLRKRYQLVIVGRMDAYAHRYVAECIEREGLGSEDVVLTGFVSDADLVNLYKCCELFVFPSISEGFGLPPLEAMACGAAVIGSSTTSIPEVIGRADAMFDPAEPGDIARTMERFLSDPARLVELRAHGLERAKLFSWQDAAQRAIASFEAVWKNKRAVDGGQVAPGHVSLGRVKERLAIISQTHQSALRHIAYLRTVLPDLAAFYDVTLISLDGAPDDLRLRANWEVNDLPWFQANASRFSRVLYNLDLFASAEMVAFLRAHRGVVLLHVPLTEARMNVDAGSSLSSRVQRDLFIVGGYRGLLEALEAGEEGRAVIARRAGAELLQECAGLILESPESVSILPNSRGAGAVHLIPTMPVALDGSDSSAFRNALRIPKGADVFLGCAANAAAAWRLMSAFRTALSNSTKLAHLVLYVHDRSRGTTDKQIVRLGSLPGRVHWIGHEFDERYAEVLAAADAVMLVGDLEQHFSERLQADAVASGRPVRVVTGSPGEATVFADEQRNQLEAIFEELAAAERFDPAAEQGTTSLPHSSVIAKALWEAIERATLDGPHTRYKEIIRSFPKCVRGVKPSADDLIQVSCAIADNESLSRGPTVFVDVTTFAGPDAGTRIGFTNRRFLMDLLRNWPTDRKLEPVYFDRSNFVSARQYVGRLIGLDHTHIADEKIRVRAGDLMVGFDELRPFAPASWHELRRLQALGARCLYVATEDLLLLRPDLHAVVALVSIDGIMSPPPSVRGAVTILKGPSALQRSPNAARRLSGQVQRLEAMRGEGLYVSVSVLTADSALPTFLKKPASTFVNVPQVSLSLPSAEALSRHFSETSNARPPRFTASDLTFTVMGHVQWIYSLAIVNRAVARALERGYPGRVRLLAYETNPVNSANHVPAEDRQLIETLLARPAFSSGMEVLISQHYPVLPPQQGWPAAALALFAWEESHVPAATIETLTASFSGVIAPSATVAKALIDSGLSIPVAAIGQPSDVEAFIRLGESPRPARNGTNFLHVSSCFPRKGVDVLLAAWGEAFTASDNVTLIIKTFPNPHNTVEADVAALKRAIPNCARIEIVNADVDKEEMSRLYAKADVMVLPTRGEGYNLPALESMLAGIPLIVTGYGGHLQFCTEDEARFLKYKFAHSASHVSGGVSLWAEPSVRDLVAALREMVDHEKAEVIEHRRRRAQISSLIAADEADWARRLQHFALWTLNAVEVPPPRIAWISTWLVKCGIAQYSELLIGAFSPAFQENVHVLCDVRTPKPEAADASYDPIWVTEGNPQRDVLGEAIVKRGTDVVIIQHQDGLIWWDEFDRILRDRRFLDCVVIVCLHNVRNLERLPPEERQSVVEALSQVDRILVHAVADVNSLLSLGLVQNVALLPHGATASSNPLPIRKLAPSDTDPVIGCHGFFFTHKGIDKLISACAILRREWPGLKLKLVNARFDSPISDQAIAECEAIARKFDMVQAIEWHTQFLSPKAIDDHLRNCDLLVLPYHDSNDSASGAARVVLASLVPVLATRVNIFAELRDAVAWVENNDPDVLATAMAALLRDESQREDIQLRAGRWLDQHDWRSVGKTLEGIVGGLVSQRRLNAGFENEPGQAGRSGRRAEDRREDGGLGFDTALDEGYSGMPVF